MVVSIILSKIFSKIGFFAQIGFCEVFLESVFYFYITKILPK